MIEGGASVIQQAWEEQVADNIIITLAPVWLGSNAVRPCPNVQGPSALPRLVDIQWIPCGQDVLLFGRHPPLSRE